MCFKKDIFSPHAEPGWGQGFRGDHQTDFRSVWSGRQEGSNQAVSPRKHLLLSQFVSGSIDELWFWQCSFDSELLHKQKTRDCGCNFYPSDCCHCSGGLQVMSNML